MSQNACPLPRPLRLTERGQFSQEVENLIVTGLLFFQKSAISCFIPKSTTQPPKTPIVSNPTRLWGVDLEEDNYVRRAPAALSGSQWEPDPVPALSRAQLCPCLSCLVSHSARTVFSQSKGRSDFPTSSNYSISELERISSPKIDGLLTDLSGTCAFSTCHTLHERFVC